MENYAEEMKIKVQKKAEKRGYCTSDFKSEINKYNNMIRKLLKYNQGRNKGDDKKNRALLTARAISPLAHLKSQVPRPIEGISVPSANFTLLDIRLIQKSESKSKATPALYLNNMNETIADKEASGVSHFHHSGGCTVDYFFLVRIFY